MIQIRTTGGQCNLPVALIGWRASPGQRRQWSIPAPGQDLHLGASDFASRLAGKMLG